MSHPLPKLHNAMWPGLVGKGSPGAEDFIALEKMLDLTAAADVGGVKFDGVDLFLFDPHINIDISEDALKKVADAIATRGLAVGSLVAPVWPGPRVTPAPELAVRSRLDGRDLSLSIVELAFLRRRDLGPATASLLGYRDQIIRALDRLFTGI